MTSNEADSWLRPEPDARDRPVTVVHFSHAGGSAVSYRSWTRLYPADVGFVAVELPGRGRRSAVSVPDSIDAIADAVARELRDWSEHHVALFGHSLGALCAYEVARRTRRFGWAACALIVSGSRAPSEDLGRPRVAHLDRAEFCRRAVELGLASGEITTDPELAALFLEPLRQDLALCERYPWGRSAQVALPLSVLGARDDHLVPLSSARSWQQLSSQPAPVTVFSGGHMFVRDAAHDVTAAICTAARQGIWLPHAGPD
jgi:surfactin synthase thioesterase subunit